MSGDVQPRRRKDKKRKKDDSTEQIPSQPQIPLSTSQNEDVNIHVHKEDGTGGGICAKIIFFFLFSALAVLIGLIITEHRGLTDLDTADQESRFSHLFEGWIDNNVNHEEDHDDQLASSLEHDDHEDEHAEEDESPESHHDDDDEEHDEAEEEEEEEQGSEEASKVDEEEDSQAEEDEDSQAEEDDVSQPQDEDEDEDEDETGEDDDQVLESEEQEAEDDSEAKDADEVSNEKDEDEEEDEEDEATSKDVDEKSGEDEDDDVAEGEESKEDKVESEEERQSKENESEQVKDEDDDDDDEKEDEEVEDETEDNKVDEEKQGDEEAEDANNSKSVNVRHDNEPEESDSEKQSDDDVENYEYENITNKDDFQIKEKIDEAQKNIQNNAAYAIKLFDVLLQNYPSSPRSLYGKAQALDLLADQKRSNEILQQAIATYLQILELEHRVPDALYEAIADRCINRLRFMGNYNRAIVVHNKLISRFPDNPKHKNQLVVSYLTINRVNKARVILQQVLSQFPSNGFALVHYGFILKTTDNNLSEAVFYLKKGIATKEVGVIDGRFYFHLGDALARLGRNDEAMKIYEEGVKYDLFLSRYQRSLYNVAHLKGKPWWKKEDTPYINLYNALENNWEKIRNEGLNVLKKNGLFQNESENLKNKGDWKQFELFARGQKNIENCKKCPFTCKIIESIPDARGCKRGQTKFSVMHPGTHVWPHCGPTNCRLRVHLGLHVPEHTYIRVANETRSWKNGKVIIFDDSFEHEVWHNGTTLRLVLIIDVWHPELTSAEKRSLSPI